MLGGFSLNRFNLKRKQSDYMRKFCFVGRLSLVGAIAGIVSGHFDCNNSIEKSMNEL